MATKLFKDGSFIWVEAQHVQNYLSVGYSPNDPNASAPVHPPTIIPSGMGLELMPHAEAEKAILQKMGILPLPVEPVPASAEIPVQRQKRKYTRRAKA